MLALKINNNADVKTFMNKLLAENVFDFFEFREAVISSLIRFELYRERRKNDDTEETDDPTLWEKIRPYIFNIIKGGKKPKSMNIVFSFPTERIAEIDGTARALFLNIIFEGEGLLITTGRAAKSFSLDKAAEAAWDEYAEKLLKGMGIAFE